MRILAIDCGSTNLKAALFDAECRRLAEESIPVHYSVRTAEQFEMEPEEIWQSVVQLVKRTCNRARIEAQDLTHLAFASQAQTFTFVDNKGWAERPFLSWLDKRSIEEAAELASHLGAEFHRHCSFTPPIAQLQAAMLLWTKRRYPKLFGSDARLVSLPGFLTLRLSGVNAMDRNLAAMSGIYSLERGHWWDEMINRIGLGSGQLPRLVDVGETMPAEVPCRELTFTPDLKVVLAGNDQTAGAFGNDCREDFWVITLGTALVAYRCAGRMPGPFHPAGCWGPYPGGGYYELAALDKGCSALDWARARLLPGQDPQAFDAQARLDPSVEDQSPPPKLVQFFPSRMGTETAWVGEGGLPQRARAVLEGIGFSLRQLIFEDLQADNTLNSLCVTGGGSKSAYWLQMLADILNRPLQRGAGDALSGAARMAGARPAARSGEAISLITPQPRRVAFYEQRFKTWRQAEPVHRYLDGKNRLIIGKNGVRLG